jgi:hypothetical protein
MNLIHWVTVPSKRPSPLTNRRITLRHKKTIFHCFHATQREIPEDLNFCSEK